MLLTRELRTILGKLKTKKTMQDLIRVFLQKKLSMVYMYGSRRSS